VLYTSDGRDVEMSVASTKALYSQIAGRLPARHRDRETRSASRVDQAVLAALRDLPIAMQGVVERRADIAAVAHQLAPSKRYWAIVGNGTKPHRSTRAADQAVGALLQGDRVRLH